MATCLGGLSCSSGNAGPGPTGAGGTGASGSGGYPGIGAGGEQRGAGGASSATGGVQGGVGGVAGATGASGTGGNAGNGGKPGSATGSGGDDAGTAGAGGGAPAPVTPTVSSTKYTFAFGDVVLDIDAGTGARVTKLSLAGTDLIIPPASDLTTCDSTFWTSPRSDWKPKTWPPPTAIDAAAYSGAIMGTHAVLTGSKDATMGIGISKDFSADAGSGWISITYTINSTNAIKAAPWEVTRVPRGGIVFFPSGTTDMTKGPWTTLTTSSDTSPATTWVDDTTKSATSPDGSKAYGDGSGGWLAYAVGGNLFLKKFTDTPATQQAPGDGEIGVYPGPANFLEFEVQGPYTAIAASGTLPWPMKWKVIKIPSSVTIAVASPTLVAFAAQQAAD